MTKKSLLLTLALATGCGAGPVAVETVAPATTAKPQVTATEAPTTTRAPTTTAIPTTTAAPTTTIVVTTVRPPTTTARKQTVAPATNSNSFLSCVARRESGNNPTAVNPSSGAAGLFQLMPQTARNTALHAGRPDLASRPVVTWSVGDQWFIAQHLLSWQGRSPWAGGQYAC